MSTTRLSAGEDTRAVKVACPHCGRRSTAPAALLGHVIRCPKCGKDFRLAAAGDSPRPNGGAGTGFGAGAGASAGSTAGPRASEPRAREASPFAALEPAAPARTGDSERLRRQAIARIEDLARQNAPRIDDPFYTSDGYNLAEWVDRGYQEALRILDAIRSHEGEPVAAYAARVGSVLEERKLAHAADSADADGGGATALRDAMHAVETALRDEQRRG